MAIANASFHVISSVLFLYINSSHLGHLGLNGPQDRNALGSAGDHRDHTYATLIFNLLDKARPKSEGHVDRDGNEQKG